MPMLATIVLDSGVILGRDIGSDPAPTELDVGYFQCAKDHLGDDVQDIWVYANGEEVKTGNKKLVAGVINVVQKKGGGPVRITDSLKKYLLRKKSLYDHDHEPSPRYDESRLDCKLHFSSGTFRSSMVKDRRFIKEPIAGGSPIKDQHQKPIAHDVIVHFNLDDDDELSFQPSHGGAPLFTTRALPPGTTHVEIELVCNNATARRFFRDALDLSGRTDYWLPNQGDPTSTGNP